MAWQALQPMILARKVLPTPGLPISTMIGALPKEREIEQAQDAVLGLHTALVMVEVKRVDAGLRL